MLPIYVCVDQNALRSDELARLVEETSVEFVLPDAALMEMCKSEQWESTLRRSLNSLAKVPERVHFALGNGDLMSKEQVLMRPLRREDVIGFEPTTFVRMLLREVNGNVPSGPGIEQLRMRWAERRQAMAEGHLNDEENAAAVRNLIPTVRDALSAETLRRFRAGKLDGHERISIISGIVSTLFSSIMREGGIDADTAEILFTAKSCLARYLWLRVYDVVRWIELGGSETANPKITTNNCKRLLPTPCAPS